MSTQQEINTLRQQLAEAKGEVEKEQERWQALIYDLCCKATKDLSVNIDGAGCDSGDPLDFTLAEITQAINAWRDKAEQANAASGEDTKRLDWLEAQTRTSRTGISFDWLEGIRFMRFHFLGERKDNIRQAIDAAMEGSRTK